MKEEKYLKEVYGSASPFKVPEGYFDDFAARMMQQLPERQAKVVEMKSSPWLKWRPYAAAACFCAVIAGAGVFLMDRGEEKPLPLAASAVTESNVDEAADYVMFDKNDIYTYLADY